MPPTSVRSDARQLFRPMFVDRCKPSTDVVGMAWSYSISLLLQIEMAKVEYNRTHVEEKEASMKTYIFNVSLEPDEEGWRAFYAPLEHIGASTWGKTQEEARQHIHEVLSMIVEEFIEEGRELPTGDGLLITEGTAVAVTR